MRALLFALWLIASAARAQNLEDSFLRYTYRLNGSEIKELGVFGQRVPSFEEIERDQFRFKDYPQFISYLLSQAPSLKTHFIMLHHSQSLQVASEEHPRVVLFDGGSMFAFAEHPENRALRVEILEMDPQTSEIRPREIVFEKQGIRFNRDVRPDLFEGLRLTPIDLTTGRFAWLGVDCDELKTKSLQAANLAALATERFWRPYRRDQPERPPVSRCAKCHTEAMSRRAPHIPFDDTLALARMLRSTDYADRILQRIDSADSDQMPPETPLTIEEKEAMREFINALR